MLFNAQSNTDLLHIIDTTAQERKIPKSSVIESIESAITNAAKIKYGSKYDIQAFINKKTGSIKLYKVSRVVDLVENPNSEVTLEYALNIQKDAEIGGKIFESLPFISMDYQTAQLAKHVFVEKMHEAVKRQQYESFKDKVDQVLMGVVRRVDMNEVLVHIDSDQMGFGAAEAVLQKREMIPGEFFKINDKIKVLLKKINDGKFGIDMVLSRSADGMLEKLMTLEIPEIYDKQIEIKSVARDPGSKSKVAVFTTDQSIDAAGCCIGIRGSRIKNISNELNGEKVDIVMWSPDLAQFVINALKPAHITKVIIHEEKSIIEVILPKDQLSIAIGKGGQNVKLASKLVGMKVDVMTEEDEANRRSEEFNAITQEFIDGLNIEEMMAQLLAANGYKSIKQLVETDISVLAKIEGFDEELAEALQSRAIDHLEMITNEAKIEIERMGCTDELVEYLSSHEKGLDTISIATLAKQRILSLEDFSKLSVRSFRRILPKCNITNSDIQSLIEGSKQQDE